MMAAAVQSYSARLDNGDGCMWGGRVWMGGLEYLAEEGNWELVVRAKGRLPCLSARLLLAEEEGMDGPAG